VDLGIGDGARGIGTDQPGGEGGAGLSVETPKELLALWSFRLVAWLARTLPERTGRRAFDAFGRLAFRLLPGVRATVAANQAMVLGQEPGSDLVVSATKEAFSLYARYWFDTFRARILPVADLNARTITEGIENIDRALESGKGCITVLPHMGNWDIAGRWLAAHDYRIASVAEELRPRKLFELFLEHRKALGMRILPLSKDSHVGQQLGALLAQNWIVALVADRDLTGRGVEVEMFGAPRKLPAGPALLSLSTGAPLLVCPVWTTDKGWKIRIGVALEIERTGNTRADVTALTRRMASEFERAIAARPVDWHMFQPAWENRLAAGGRDGRDR
jgi:phosphatidylinositol dimannoside acyltransferase